jgi:hypothetical protein
MCILCMCQSLSEHYIKTQFEKCITSKSTVAIGKIANNSDLKVLHSFTLLFLLHWPREWFLSFFSLQFRRIILSSKKWTRKIYTVIDTLSIYTGVKSCTHDNSTHMGQVGKQEIEDITIGSWAPSWQNARRRKDWNNLVLILKTEKIW